MESIRKSSGKRNNKYIALVKNTALFAISNLGSKLITFLLVPIYTYVLNTEEYGTIDLLGTTVSLLVPVLTVNVQDAVLRFVLDEEYEAEDVVSTGLWVDIMGSIVLMILIFSLKVTNILNMDIMLLVFLFLSFILTSLNNCFTMYLKGKNQVSVLVISGLINTIILCSLNILFLVIIRIGIRGYLFANILGLAVAVGYKFFKGTIYKEIHLKKYKNHYKDMLAYSRPLIFNSLAWWINNASDRYILTFICGVAVNGIYSVAYKIPTILSTVQGIFYSAWSISAITEYDKEDRDSFVGNVYAMYSAVSVIVSSLILFLNIPLARILYSKDFFGAWQYVPLLLVGTMFNGLALFQGCIFTAARETKEVSKSTMTGAAINTFCNIILIHWMGALGAALATLIGYIVTWAMRIYRMTKIIKMKVNWKKHIICYCLLILQAFLAINTELLFLQSVIMLTLLTFQIRQIVSFMKILWWKRNK